MQNLEKKKESNKGSLQLEYSNEYATRRRRSRQTCHEKKAKKDHVQTKRGGDDQAHQQRYVAQVE